MPYIKTFLLLCFLTVTNASIAQSPYHINTNKELTYYGAGIASLGISYYFRSQINLFTEADLAQLDISTINSFDRVATNHFSLQAHELSNYFWYGSHALPFLFVAGKKTQKDFGKIFTLYGEAALLTLGVTTLTKYTIRRPRPFNFDPNTSFAKKATANAQGSFISGHTSITAVNSFFAAKVFADYYPNSKWKPVVWGTAAVIPAITGYLRVRGGRHYPTDVIGGYLVGAAFGYLIPHWHRTKLNNKNVQLQVGPNSFYVGVHF